MDKITVGVLTISDRCSRGEAEDTSGPELKRLLERGVVKNCTVVRTALVPDRTEDIERVLKEWSEERVNLILTTGGTGVASTDVTPEATTAVLDRIVPGMSQLMFKKSSEVTALAALSRSVAGIRDKTLIVNLPGSRKASEECLKAVAGVVPHAIDLILGRQKAVEKVHYPQGQKRSLVKVSDPNRQKGTSPYERIPVSKAQEMILESVFLIKKEVVVEYKEALGHVLAQDVASQVNLPPCDVSLKDGYAICHSSTTGFVVGESKTRYQPSFGQALGHVPSKVNRPSCDVSLKDDIYRSRSSTTLLVVGESKTGDQPSEDVVRPDCCVRISTGAPMPPGTDTVVMIENTHRTDKGDGKEWITFSNLPQKGQDVRKKGSDFRMGSLLLPFGTYLDAGAVGLCSAAGVTAMRVFKKPLVAVMSTGDELLDPQTAISPGKVWDSNRITLMGLLKEHGFEALDCGIVKDEPDALRDALEEAFREVDVVVTTGSMSMGARDYLKDVLLADFDADILFGRVLMKPGLPTTFATVLFGEDMKLFFGLPGNPASAFVTSHLFLLPALRKISGHGQVLPPTKTVVVPKEEYPALEDRPHYVRGTLTSPWTDNSLARVTGEQRSSRISSCVNANCLLLFPELNGRGKNEGEENTATALLIGQFPFRG